MSEKEIGKTEEYGDLKIIWQVVPSKKELDSSIYMEVETSIKIYYKKFLVYQSHSIRKDENSILRQTCGLSLRAKKDNTSDFYKIANDFLTDFNNRYEKNDAAEMISNLLRFNHFPAIFTTLSNDLEKSLDESDNSEGKQNIAHNKPVLILYQTYSQFEQDIDMLLREKIIKKTQSGLLNWLKSKQSLAEYSANLAYGYKGDLQDTKKDNIHWKVITDAFGASDPQKIKDLRYSMNSATKISKDFENILKLLNEHRGKSPS